jgi:hypothetical protein
MKHNAETIEKIKARKAARSILEAYGFEDAWSMSELTLFRIISLYQHTGVMPDPKMLRNG